VPGTVRPVAASPSQGECHADACGGLACVLGELDAGGQATVAVEVVPLAAGTLAHPVSVPSQRRIPPPGVGSGEQDHRWLL
jgi:hypothetical protein